MQLFFEDTIKFFKVLYPDDTFINIRCISDRSSRAIPKNYILSKEDWLSGHTYIEDIYQHNRISHYGIFSCINTSDKKPEEKNSFSGHHITSVNAQFFEIDPNIPRGLSTAEELTIIGNSKISQWNSIFSAPIRPTLIVETRKSYHVYYKLKPAKEQSSENMIKLFSDIQKGLVSYFSSDSSTQSLVFPMRLPGYYHNKKEPFSVKIAHCEPENIYTQYDIISAFGIRTPVIKRNPVIYKRSIKVIENAEIRDVDELLNRCEHINYYYHTPTDMGYSIWFGIGTNLIKLGTPGEEVWADMSRRDSDNFSEIDFTKKLEDIKKTVYCYGCGKLTCPKYLEAIEKELPIPCGVHTPIMLLNKFHSKNEYISYTPIQYKSEISQEEARLLIQQEYEKILIENKPGIYYIKVPCGIGKTMGLVEVLKSHLSVTPKKVLWLGDTHKQIIEVLQQFDEFKTIHLKSRKNMEDLKETCTNIDIIENYYHKKGLNARYTHCFTKKCPLSEEKVTDECIYASNVLKNFKIHKTKTISGAKNCKYMQQYKQIPSCDIVFGAHNRINMANTIKPDILVIDENFLNKYKYRVEFTHNDVEFSIRLLEACINKASFNDREILHVIIELLKNLDLFLNSANIIEFITREMADTLTKINERFMLSLTRKAEITGRSLKVKNVECNRCRFILDYMIYLVRPILTNQGSSLLSHVQSLKFQKDENSYSFTRKSEIPENCITFILDATTPKELYEGVVGKSIYTYDVSEQSYIKQESRMILVNIGKYTKSHLCSSNNRYHTVVRAFEFIDKIVREKMYTSVGLITFNDVYNTLDTDFGTSVEEIIKSARVVCEHFNNLRGKNQFRECDAVFVLGFMQHPSQEIAKSAFTLLDMDVPLEELIDDTTQDMKSSYIGIPLPLIDSSQPHTLEIQKVDFRHKETSYIYETYCIGELVQAIGRARIYDKRDNRQDIYVMTTMESSGMFRYDEIIDAHEWDRNHVKRAETLSIKADESFNLLIEKAKEKELIVSGNRLPSAMDLHILAKEENIDIGRDKIYELYKVYKAKVKNE